MKNIVFLLSLLSVQITFAQSIDSITIIPANPIYGDTVYAHLYCTKAMSMDYLRRITVSAAEDSILIHGYGMSCGGWSVITNFDTIIEIGQIMPGNYVIVGITCADSNTTDSTCDIEPQTYCFDTITSSLLITGTIDELEESIRIFPNPFGSKLKIELGMAYKDVELILYNQSGQIVKQILMTNINELELNRSGLPNGLYLLRVLLNSENSVVNKVMIFD